MRCLCLALFALAILSSASACGEIDDRPVSFRYIHATILQPNCATSGCHSKFTAAFGIRLETPEEAYTSLVLANHVEPGQPDRSRLLYLLRGDEVATRMPPSQPLPELDIELIERWIIDGAPNN